MRFALHHSGGRLASCEVVWSYASSTVLGGVPLSRRRASSMALSRLMHFRFWRDSSIDPCLHAAASTRRLRAWGLRRRCGSHLWHTSTRACSFQCGAMAVAQRPARACSARCRLKAKEHVGDIGGLNVRFFDGALVSQRWGGVWVRCCVPTLARGGRSSMCDCLLRNLMRCVFWMNEFVVQQRALLAVMWRVKCVCCLAVYDVEATRLQMGTTARQGHAHSERRQCRQGQG